MFSWRQSLFVACLASSTLSKLAAEPVEYLSRVGLSVVDSQFISDGVSRLTNTGFIAGHSSSESIAGDPAFTYAGWIAGIDGQTHRVGLYDLAGGNEFTAANGNQYSQIQGLTETGRTWGSSSRYGGLAPTGFSAPLGFAAWMADSTGATLRVGLVGAQFTRGDGYSVSGINSINGAGSGIGSSFRYNGMADAGVGVWYFDSTGATTRTGFYDEGGGNEFTRADGYQRSSWDGEISSSGYFLGSSVRYNGGSSDLGSAQWVGNVSGGTLVRVGLYDAGGSGQYTRADGYQFSRGFFTDEQIIYGTADRFSGSLEKGKAAWLSDVSGQAVRAGFYDQGGGNVYTRSDGRQESGFTSAKGSYFAGWSTRFLGSGSSLGTAAWTVTTSGTTTRIGFFDQFGGNEFTRSDGFQSSLAYGVTKTGYANGYSTRFKGGMSELGQAVWRFDPGGATTRLGLFDQGGGNEFTRANGYQYSSSSDAFLRNSGYIAGESTRFVGGGSSKGSAGWVADASGTTRRVGLYDQGGGNEYTRTDGYQYTDVEVLTESGYSGGYSERFSGSAAKGYDAWIATPDGVVIDLSLSDAIHTASDGSQRSKTIRISEAGLTTGSAERYSGTTYIGATAWVFDPASNQQLTFDLSTRASDGYARSAFEDISSNGVAYGSFDLFDGNVNLGERAFIWSADFGTLVLDEAISGGIAQYGWASFLDIDFTNAGGIFVGSGDMSSGEGVYVVRVVPEPSSLLLAAFGAIAVLGSRRRRCTVS